MYYFDSPVRFSEVDEAEYLRYGNMIDYFQDTSFMADDYLGFSGDYWKEKGLYWILSAWDIVIHSRPKLGERISVGTGLSHYKHCFVDRYYEIKKDDEAPMITGMALWTALSLKNHMPIKVNMDFQIETHPMEGANRKLKFPKELEKISEVNVYLRDVDHNHHLNNAAYLKLALEYLPMGLDLKRIQISYLKPWVKGCSMFIYGLQEGDKIYYSLRNELEEEYCRMILEVERI